MNKVLNGPSINFDSGEFDKIIIFLHGYGANGNDLISIGNRWQRNSLILCLYHLMLHLNALGK